VTRENGQRHAAVRPDVNAGNQRLRTWVWTGGRNTNSIAWVVELGENRYLRCDLDAGRLVEYEAVATPSASSMFRHWEEQP
jgi:hypothetical protein